MTHESRDGYLEIVMNNFFSKRKFQSTFSLERIQ